MVIDCITYNGEKELFDLRYNILKDYVDEFIVVEFDKTFSGRDKPWYFEEIVANYPKVRYNKITNWEKYKELAKSSPNTVGAEHWKTEFCQKESIKDCLTHLKDDDIVFIGDCDEIWNPEDLILWQVIGNKNIISKIKLLVYTYWLDNKSDEQFWGTITGLYKNVKNECLNHIRTNSIKMRDNRGWHFTSMAKSLKQKLKDSYTDEDYASDVVLDNLEENIKNNKDFLGRDFKYEIDEREWPTYLKENRQKYINMLK